MYESEVYESLRHSYPHIFEGTSWAAWLRILEEAGLTSIRHVRLFIIDAGQEFLAAKPLASTLEPA